MLARSHCIKQACRESRLSAAVLIFGKAKLTGRSLRGGQSLLNLNPASRANARRMRQSDFLLQAEQKDFVVRIAIKFCRGDNAARWRWN
jgi:hypothetical protein